VLVRRGPAPCASYLRQNVLAPGATYRDRLTWDQRTGHPDLPVPSAATSSGRIYKGCSCAPPLFAITRSRSLIVALADSGHRFALAAGDYLIVRLLASPLVWTTAVSSAPRTLIALPKINPVAGVYVFRALAPGTARRLRRRESSLLPPVPDAQPTLLRHRDRSRA